MTDSNETPPASNLTEMEKILNGMLAQAKMPEGEVATVEVQLFFKDGTMLAGMVKHGPLDRTYVLGGKAAGPDGRPVEDKIAELYFHGGDLARLCVMREVQVIRRVASPILIPH